MNESFVFVLTRYLYIKEDVLMSLLVSILEKDYDQSLFWTSELYFSGFQEEVVAYIYAIYKNIFYSNNPRLKRVMEIGLKRYDKGIHIAATMLLNLTSKARTFTLHDFMVKNEEPDEIPNAKENESKIMIFCNIDEANKYNDYIKETNNQLILKEACKYQVKREWVDVFECAYQHMTSKEIFNKIIHNWLFYASYSPLWKKRIEECHGIIDEENEKVHFENDEWLETFNEHYYYDLDEQNITVQQKIFGSSILKKCNINDFYKKYEPGVKIHKLKLKRVNNKCSESK